MLNELFLGHLNTPAAPYLVYLGGLLLTVTVFTTKVVQFVVVLGVLTIVLTDKIVRGCKVSRPDTDNLKIKKPLKNV